MNTFRSIGAAAITTLALFAGCDAQHKSTSGSAVAEKVDLDLETPRTTVVAGDTATITARSKDTYGRDATVKWTTTGGKLTTEERGRLARVKFDTPGNYTVTATLVVDGKETRTDSVNFQVKPTT